VILRNTHSISRRQLAVVPPTRCYLTILLTISFLLGGCQQIPDEPTVEIKTPIAVIPPSIDPLLLITLMDAAEQAIEAGQFTYPSQGSALDLYHQILAIEPRQEDAERGLERLVELHVERAMTALGKAQYASARSMLARAKLINPNHPSIEPTQAQIRLLSNADKKFLKLDQAELARQAHSLRERVMQLALPQPGKACRFTILAKNDTQGRWIYEQLSKGNPSGRIRAQIALRLPAGIERQCFAVK